jgi:hypothetical protein
MLEPELSLHIYDLFFISYFLDPHSTVECPDPAVYKHLMGETLNQLTE